MSDFILMKLKSILKTLTLVQVNHSILEYIANLRLKVNTVITITEVKIRQLKPIWHDYSIDVMKREQ